MPAMINNLRHVEGVFPVVGTICSTTDCVVLMHLLGLQAGEPEGGYKYL